MPRFSFEIKSASWKHYSANDDAVITVRTDNEELARQIFAFSARHEFRSIITSNTMGEDAKYVLHVKLSDEKVDRCLLLMNYINELGNQRRETK